MIRTFFFTPPKTKVTIAGKSPSLIGDTYIFNWLVFPLSCYFSRGGSKPMTCGELPSPVSCLHHLGLVA